MPNDPANFRPKAYPPPQFPPHKPKLFARTPLAVFPVILGLLGLALALRRALDLSGQSLAVADAALGAAVALWAFAALAYAVKLLRRPSVIWEDLRPLPGRTGLSAATVGGMAVAAGLAPFAPDLAKIWLWIALALHAAQLFVLLTALRRGPPEARRVNPGFHLAFVGFIVGGFSAAVLGDMLLAKVILWVMLPIASIIWAISAAQLLAEQPPAPLRPLLAIHLAPASLIASVAALTGQTLLSDVAIVFATLLVLAGFLSLRWIVTTGFSALWGAFTFPLTAYASALILHGGLWATAGQGVTAAALVIVSLIAWKVLSLWPGGRLAAKTNAAEA
jgi:tellurite resistance protein